MSKINELINKLCPNGVRYNKLSEIGNQFSGLSGKSKNDFENGNCKYITYTNIYNNPSTNLDVEDYVQVKENEKQNEIKYKDILVAGSSENLEDSGMISVVTKEPNEKIYLNSFCFGFRLNDNFYDKYNPNFLKHLFRDKNFRNEIISCSFGVTRYNLSKEKFLKIKIPCPPLEVQEEIVKILDKFGKLEAELEAELEARKSQYEFWREKLLNTGNSNQEYITLGDIGKVCMCKRIMKNETSDSGDVPFYKIGTFGKQADAYISYDIFNDYKKRFSYPKKGEILVSCSGTIGRSVVFDGEDAYFQDSNIVWLSNDESKVLNKFLYYFYQTSPWNISDGGTIKRLYNNQFISAKVPLYSLEEQKKIVNILERFDKLINDISEGLPAEIELRRKQYDYYRNKLLSFEELSCE